MLKRVKEIKQELTEKVDTFQKDVLERTDELEQLGQIAAERSKQFSKQIHSLSQVVPPVELDASIKNLETEIKCKLAEMDVKIKKVKKKKKAEKKVEAGKKVEKKTI